MGYFDADGNPIIQDMFATGYMPPEADASQDISSASLMRENGINTLKFRKKITSGDIKARHNMELSLHINELHVLSFYRIWTLLRTSM